MRSLTFYSIAWIGMLASAFGVDARQTLDPDERRVKLMMSFSMFTETNENDARAAFKVWTRKLAELENTPTDDTIKIANDVPMMLREMEFSQDHLVSITLPEFFQFPSDTFSETVFYSIYDDSPATTYLLLVKDSSSIQSLKDLAQAKLILFENRTTSLSRYWLDAQLRDQGFPAMDQHFSEIVLSPQLSRSILPVFFGQADACLVSEDGFRLMAELNPQIGKQLRVIAKSPAVIGSATFMQAGYDPKLEEFLVRIVARISEEPSGHQVLTLFRSDGLIIDSMEPLKETFAWWEKWNGIQATQGEGAAVIKQETGEEEP